MSLARAAPLPPPRVVVFDLDGTLLDSVGDLTFAVNEVMRARDRAPWPQQQVRAWVGEGADLLIARCLTGGFEDRAAPHDVAAALAEFRSVYIDRCWVDSTLLPGALEAMDDVRARGIATAVLTNKPSAPTRRIMEHFEIMSRVDGWLGGDAAVGRKPDPAPLLALAADALRETPDPATIWMIGDSVTDIATAKNAGAVAIAVRGGYDDAAPIDRCTPRPDRTIDRLSELGRLIEAFAPLR
ncbi:MAG: HAD-IA family hydrolase [Phycisphaerae bacterium]|nr:HAD-IA family hydrolase [Phycisphaerae bacterium]